MELNSELEVLLFATDQFMRSKDDSEARIHALQQDLHCLQQRLNDENELETKLLDRLKAVVVRSGLIQEREIHNYDLATLEAAAREQISRASHKSLPNNVFVLPISRLGDTFSKTRSTNKDPEKVKTAVTKALSSLGENEARVVKKVFGIATEEGKTLSGREVFLQEYVARELGISQSSVSRFYRKALRKLRHPSRSDDLRNLLEGVDPDNPEMREENLLVQIFGPSTSLY